MAFTYQGLDRSILELKSKNEETKLKAANELRENVVLYSRGKLYRRIKPIELTILFRASPRKV